MTIPASLRRLNRKSNGRRRRISGAVISLWISMNLLTACSGTAAAIAEPEAAGLEPAAAGPQSADPALSPGQYLTNLLGCGRCHTEGYLTGDEATGPYLAGSRMGMAYTAYSMDTRNPGVVFPSNLTGDPETGLGDWSVEEIVVAMTEGIARSGHERLMIMPWVNYNAITPADLEAIARYLKSLGAVDRQIPAAITEGEPSPYPYVRYGIYEFTPHTRPEDLEP